MTPEQCKEARALLNWSRADLAEAADLPEMVIEMYEDDELTGLASCEIAMRNAMMAAGIGFPDTSHDARRSPNSVTYKAPARPCAIGARGPGEPRPVRGVLQRAYAWATGVWRQG